MPALLKLRPADPDDEPFLRDLRAQVDAERLGLQYWPQGQEQLARAILDLQFKAHASHYRQVKSNWDTKDCIIELEGKPAGRFIVTQNSKEVQLADIAVHRDYRGLGLGQAVIEAIQGECLQSKRVLRLHVDPLNTAVQFYQKLGFKIVEAKPTDYLMEWQPPTTPGKTVYFPGAAGS
ncbi:MAG TPA: GNAT family N-acetyltransferase [Opitutaceae bacterium]|jgi:ribosomal protein S18 acetylase RimI-like enzyme|nr:GNAT family N-acetyltransferase [Opitutaceae bacterium]